MTDKTGFAQRAFKDAGTEQAFAAGDKVTVPEGQYANYLAAGLVGDKAPKKAEAGAETPKTAA